MTTSTMSLQDTLEPYVLSVMQLVSVIHLKGPGRLVPRDLDDLVIQNSSLPQLLHSSCTNPMVPPDGDPRKFPGPWEQLAIK